MNHLTLALPIACALLLSLTEHPAEACSCAESLGPDWVVLPRAGMRDGPCTPLLVFPAASRFEPIELPVALPGTQKTMPGGSRALRR